MLGVQEAIATTIRELLPKNIVSGQFPVTFRPLIGSALTWASQMLKSARSIRGQPTFFLLALMAALLSSHYARRQRSQAVPLNFEGLLKTLSSSPAIACEPLSKDFSDIEYRLFQSADDSISQAMNKSEPSSLSGTSNSVPAGTPAVGRAISELRRMERLSVEVNKARPEDKRFHFQTLDVSPALVVKMTYRNRATFSFFAIPERDDYNKPNALWRSAGAIDDHKAKSAGGHDLLDIFPLERGPSQRARFLAKFGGAGCGSGVGVGYYAYEWNPQFAGSGLDLFINADGAQSHFEPVDKEKAPTGNDEEFLPIGKVQTQGPIITLPFCWFSPIDTYNNPSLCAVESYDISGDRAKFVGETWNRPDLLPVAKAIKYAQARDYPAVLAYCGSSDVASRMVSEMPTYLSGAAGFEIKPITAVLKRVEIGDDPTFQIVWIVPRCGFSVSCCYTDGTWRFITPTRAPLR